MRYHIIALIVLFSSITVSVSAANGNWENQSSWNGISNGMSERQVVSILGKPTSAKDLGSMRTLFYRGDVAGSGFIFNTYIKAMMPYTNS